MGSRGADSRDSKHDGYHKLTLGTLEYSHVLAYANNWTKEVLMKCFVTFLGLTLLTIHAEYLGNLSANPFDPNSIPDPYGAGNPYVSNSVTNEFGLYGNPCSNQFATRAPNPRPFEKVSAKNVPTLDASARRSVSTYKIQETIESMGQTARTGQSLAWRKALCVTLAS